jgi:hypothetical protein
MPNLKAVPSSGAVEYRNGAAVDRRAAAWERVHAYRAYLRDHPGATNLRAAYDESGTFRVIGHTGPTRSKPTPVAPAPAMPAMTQWQACGYYRKPAAR